MLSDYAVRGRENVGCISMIGKLVELGGTGGGRGDGEGGGT